MICCVVFALCLMQFCTQAYTGQDSLAPDSHLKEDAPEMALMAIVASVWGKIQRGEILVGDDKSQIWSTLMAELKMQSAFVQNSIELDKGLPVQITTRPDGSMALDVMAWIQQKPKRVACVNNKCMFLTPRLPPLLHRVHARGGRLLEQEIPQGALKAFLKIIRENGLNELIVFGGTVRNLLLERQYVDGDLDILVWVKPTDDQKQEAQRAGWTKAQLYDELHMRLKAKVEKCFKQDWTKMTFEGVPVEFIGRLDEELHFEGSFQKEYRGLNLKDIPGISINNIGIFPDTLQLFDPVEGSSDLFHRRLRYCGRTIQQGVDYHLVFRMLRLKSQLGYLGMRLDASSAKILEESLKIPLPQSSPAVMKWATMIADLKDAHRDLDHNIHEIRRLYKAGRNPWDPGDPDHWRVRYIA